MNKREDLRDFFQSISGSPHVYFQPPSDLKIQYPAIIYLLERENTHADDLVYKQTQRYRVTVIDSNPESSISEAISKMPTCRFERHYTTQGLHYDTYRIFI